MNRPCRLQSVRRLDTRVLALLAVVADDRIAERTPEDRGQRAEDDGHDPAPHVSSIHLRVCARAFYTYYPGSGKYGYIGLTRSPFLLFYPAVHSLLGTSNGDYGYFR